MIDYKLAKKLKKAGYPLMGGCRECRPCRKHQDTIDYDCEDCGWAPLPSLSELIKACGDKFYWLIRGQVSREDKTPMWEAKAIPPSMVRDAEGMSPEEAVAKLWINLNKSSGSPKRVKQ